MRVALFVTCLVDLFRPRVGFATVKLLEQAGCEVVVPPQQTCCGQPAYNNGDTHGARAIARNVIDTFSDADHVVVPSGSCAGMLRGHYPQLFDEEPTWRARAGALAGRCHELTGFLTDVLQYEHIAPDYPGTATYHDSCASLRELDIKAQPRALLTRVPGLTLQEMDGTENCCGFGGTFCVKYPEISARMVQDKTDAVRATGANMVLGNDLGCLVNIAGRLKREGESVRVHHIAEVLAGMANAPGIGDDEAP